MNKERRKELSGIIAKIGDVSRQADEIHQEIWAALVGMLERAEEFAGEIEELKSEIESAKDDEQSYYDDMPESFQNGDKGSTAQEAIDAMDRAMDSMQSAMDGWANLTGAIETIRDFEVGTEVEGSCDEAINELENAAS